MERIIENITKVLKTIKYPGFSRDIISFGIVKKVNVDPNSNLRIDIELNTDNEENKNIIETNVKQKIDDNFKFNSVNINFINESSSTQNNPTKNIKNMVVVQKLNHLIIY